MSLEVHLGQTTGFSGGGSLGRPFASSLVSFSFFFFFFFVVVVVSSFSSAFSSFFSHTSFFLCSIVSSSFEMSTTVGAFRFFVVVVIVVVGVGVGVVFILSFSNIFLSFKSNLFQDIFLSGENSNLLRLRL